ncbi:tetratricopeptide repeat protein,ATPase [Beggiatoa alba B18LD]|uniref:Tetratricopeptide repeat protein,ATPase n=1 Tax=Beggiatoa alba B18LD TaxID=395493 RepID=I3CJ10_9GAMM|nr:tetratricopeptide repeat protein [Beggiatoa alba]EIJ43603.1 tetratricopeptide repeat protein,ATPase [Beggiatoa alba B18LD]
MGIEFVGRVAELQRFQSLLNKKQGELWAICGEGGLGKSSLLREFVTHCERQKRDYLFIDVEQLSTYKTAAEFLLSLSATHLPEFEKAQQKAHGIYQTVQTQLQTGFETFKPEWQGVITGLKETYITEEYEKQFAAVVDKHFTLFLSAVSKMWHSKADAEKKRIAENIEGYLINSLKTLCKAHPIIFIDTYEHLEVKIALNEQFIATQLTQQFETSQHITTCSLKNWINRWLDFLSQHGAIVIVTGRQFKIWRNNVTYLSRFTDSEILTVIRLSPYPILKQLIEHKVIALIKAGHHFNYSQFRTILKTDTQCQKNALIQVLKKLSFDGSPLWLAVGLNLVALLLKEGKDIIALAQEDDTLKRCFEEIDGTLESDEIQHASCKMAIFNRITRQLPDEVVENAWRLALPCYLDKDILQTLLGDSAEYLIELYKNLQILNFKRSEGQFFLHESIRDLLVFYAKSKNYWNSELTNQLHKQLADLFAKKAKRNAVFLEKITVEWLDLSLAEEMYFHQHGGQTVDLESCLGKEQYWLARACQAIEKNKGNAWGWFWLGYILSKLNRYEEALASYDEAIQFKPDNALAWFNRGNVLSNLNRYEKALASYDKAIQFKPDDAEAWLNRGVALWKLGLFTEAAKNFDDCLKIQPNNLLALSNDIELALVQNDLERMQRRLTVALPLLKNNDQAFVVIPFLQWVANPESSLQALFFAIQEHLPIIKVDGDFSDIQPAILRLSPVHQQIAQQFIDYFQGKISVETLQANVTVANAS